MNAETENTVASSQNQPIIETHPWAPFIPDGARILIMGTFPPGSHRWKMDFYYPNPTNDFWRVMGLIFFGDAMALYDSTAKCFDLDKIKSLLRREHIAMSDTGYKVKRLRGNASDKFLEIVEPVNLDRLLELMPQLNTIATTGEKAAGVIAEITDTEAPKTGRYVDTEYRGRRLRIWRMPSTSRAYPLPLKDKAEQYSKIFDPQRAFSDAMVASGSGLENT